MKRLDATVAGVVLVFALAYLDAAWEDTVIASTVVLGPFLTATFASARNTAGVAAFAILSAVLSGGYNDNYGSNDYFVRLLVTIAGSVVAVLAARAMRRSAADQKRFELLRGAAELRDRGSSVPDVVHRVGELLVPELADICVIDVVRGGRVERLEIATSLPDAERIQAFLRARGPATPAEIDAAVPWLKARVDDEFLRRDARDEEDYERLRALGERSRIRVPLRSRGVNIGRLVLLGVKRSYDGADFELAQLVAGRIGLALDNAGLFADLEALQAQLTTALGVLAEAVVIQDAGGRMVYANDAAGRMFGYESGEAMAASAPESILERFESFLEDGSRLTVERLPGRQALRGSEPQPLLLRMVDRVTGDERWRFLKATRLRGPDGQRLAVSVIDDVTGVKRAELEQRFLARASAALLAALDADQMLAELAELAVPELAESCVVLLGEELRARAGTPCAVPEQAWEVLRDGESRLVEGGALLPLCAGPRVLGVIVLSGLRRADLALASELGARAGAAVETARLYQERTHIAATLQRGLLPEALPEIPGLRLASLYRPAGEENLVGGDFYDVFETPTGWMLLVGDVTGRGAKAAALTGQARHTLRTAALLLGDPEAALDQLNQALAQRRELTPCTVALIHLAPGGRAATVYCAGHPQPLLVRGGAVRPVGHFGAMLGAWAPVSWRPDRVELEPGDVLVAFSDGVIDTVGEHERFGEERLLATLTGVTDARGAVAAIDAALNRFQSGGQADDTAVLAFDLPT